MWVCLFASSPGQPLFFSLSKIDVELFLKTPYVPHSRASILYTPTNTIYKFKNFPNSTKKQLISIYIYIYLI